MKAYQQNWEVSSTINFINQARNNFDLWLFIFSSVILFIFKTFLLLIHDSCCPSFALICTLHWIQLASNAGECSFHLVTGKKKGNKSKYVSLRPQIRVMKNPDQQTYFLKISPKYHLFSHRKIKVRK